MSDYDTAVKESRQLTAKPTNDELLELYSLFKVGNAEDRDKAPKPGMFDMAGKAKLKSWDKLLEEGITATQAKERYVKLVNALKEKYGFDPAKKPE
ncbi:diazepam-binding inhibitor [Patellaria atrata CBS 101060]|uniref:Diazepam-binding inhibitor n=1 Tax=Patellaria atrata CBS 101060 TaxID=1346257 RepID=A0A9P4S4L1_9PEZI|nr:diazepam-binding inhibitor [Patellaria atrata CBS 101060]